MPDPLIRDMFRESTLTEWIWKDGYETAVKALANEFGAKLTDQFFAGWQKGRVETLRESIVDAAYVCFPMLQGLAREKVALTDDVLNLHNALLEMMRASNSNDAEQCLLALEKDVFAEAWED
jgi:hypothetical protein